MSEPVRDFNPFPGLRPFEFEEYNLFFGREGQSDKLVARLGRRHFLAVVGTSGSGKSSLVRAGLLPALRGGLMARTGSAWRTALMRPGHDPVGNLAAALAAEDVLEEAGGGLRGEEAEAVIEATLRRGALGLVEAARQARLGPRDNLLVVVDQFEELFRFRDKRDAEDTDAAAFVKLLLEASRQRELPVYVVITMRSDFLGDCSRFQGLPEAINEAQFLVPRMTRDERRIAITGPAAVAHGKMSEPLVGRLLNDVGDNPDQLPILQHALMRTWEHRAARARDGKLVELEDYEAVGAMENALSRHADEAFDELKDGRSRRVAEVMFKALTERGTDNRETRRPTRLSEICDAAGASVEEVKAVIEVFRREGRSFLMPPENVRLEPDTVIDISHESLIRIWKRLEKWVNEEAESARTFRQLAYRADDDNHLTGSSLDTALEWRTRHNPNAAWAERYVEAFGLPVGYERVAAFIDESKRLRDDRLEDEKRRREEEDERKRVELERAQKLAEAESRRAEAESQRAEAESQRAESERQRGEEREKSRRRLRRLTWALAALLLLAVGTAVVAVAATVRAQAKEKEAQTEREKAEVQKTRAETYARISREDYERAEAAKRDAERAKDDAEKAKGEALEAKQLAETEAQRANEQAGIAAARARAARKAEEHALKTSGANSTFRRAVAAQRAGDVTSAVSTYEDAAKLFAALPDLNGEADTQIALGGLYLENEKEASAFKPGVLGSGVPTDQFDKEVALHFDKAVALYRKGKNYEGVASALNRTGHFFLRRKETEEEGVRRLKESLEAYRMTKNVEGRRKVLDSLIVTINASGDERRRPEVRRYVDEAISTYDPRQDEQSLRYVLASAGNLCLSWGDTGCADEYFDRAIKVAKEAGGLASEVEALILLAAERERFGKSADYFEKYYDRAAQAFVRLPNARQLADTVMEKTRPQKPSDYSDRTSVVRLKLALLLYEKERDGKKIAPILQELGRRYFGLTYTSDSYSRTPVQSPELVRRYYPLALDAYTKALAIYQAEGNQKEVDFLRQNITALGQALDSIRQPRPSP